MAVDTGQRARSDRSSGAPERFDTVVVGGGQAGLGIGHHLAQAGRSFVILDANERTGDSWRSRWTSLRVFTPARYSSLPGWAFPAPAWTYPTKDDVADYLEAYAARFELPVRHGCRVERLSRDGDTFVLAVGPDRIVANNVVVATGPLHAPRIPAFAPELDPGIVQLHAGAYRDPSQLQDGRVLVVGAANSGAEIALDVSHAFGTWLSGRHPGNEPMRAGSVWDRFLTVPFWFFVNDVLTVDTAIGRKLRPRILATTAPLGRVRLKQLEAAGVERVPRTSGVRDGLPELEDGGVLDPANVIWCTGFRPDFSWIDLPVFGEDGQPRHDRGVVAAEPGLYFLGLPFLYALTSFLIGGVGRDAAHLAAQIAARSRAAA